MPPLKLVPGRTVSQIGKYKVYGDEELPVQRIGVLADRAGVIALDKPKCLYTFLTHFHYSGYPQLYDCIKYFWPDGAHAHRIDGTTSGTHMAGRDHDALSFIVRGWKTLVTKEYLAVISAKPKWDNLEVTQTVIGGGRTMAPCTTGLEYMGDNLVKATLLDGGRTHQIRKALQAIGSPIVGDVLYGGERAATRPLLHAWRVTVDGWGVVKSNTPEDMPDSPEYDPYLWSFDVAPLTPEMQIELNEFRKANRGGVYPKWKDGYWKPLAIYDGSDNEINALQLKELRSAQAS